jgi:hypothetical protein
LAEGTGIFFLGGPATDAVGVVGVVAGAPADHAGFTVGYFIGLTLETGLIDAVFADGAVLNCYVPAPQCDGVPLFHLYPFVNLHIITYIFELELKFKEY